MKYFLFLCALMLGSASFAQTNSEQPIEITASKSVEWLRNQNQYVARENVIVTQGNMQIFSDLLTADYRDGATSSTEIWQITAEGNVQIRDDKNTAYGDKGVYTGVILRSTGMPHGLGRMIYDEDGRIYEGDWYVFLLICLPMPLLCISIS